MVTPGLLFLACLLLVLTVMSLVYVYSLPLKNEIIFMKCFCAKVTLTFGVFRTPGTRLIYT